jgi:uncharacterized membrane protein
MWWMIAIAALSLVAFLVVMSVFPQHPKRRARMHDFERHDVTEHLYKY